MNDRIDTLERLQRNLTLVVRRTATPRAHERIVGGAGVDIDRVEAIALGRIVDAGELQVTELARGMGVACSTAGRHAANLEDDGLVTRTPDPTDRRVTVVAATARGVTLVRRLRAAYREVLSEVLDGWADEDVGRLTDLLGRLAGDLTASIDREQARV